MNTLSFTSAAAAILVLAGCQQKAETVTTTAPDPMAAELANAAPVELPPSMKASVAFRCKDNSLAFRSEEHTSELQSLMRISYAVFCLNKKNNKLNTPI